MDQEFVYYRVDDILSDIKGSSSPIFEEQVFKHPELLSARQQAGMWYNKRKDGISMKYVMNERPNADKEKIDKMLHSCILILVMYAMNTQWLEMIWI